MSAEAGANVVQLLLGVLSGLGLAAACGLRVFLPLLAASIAVRTGVFEVQEGFAWLGSTPALVAFSVATVLEIAAYYVPVLDNLLDTVATPAAAAAGALLATAAMVEMEPWLRWTLGIVAGAGLATTVQLPTAALRGGSTVTTAGVANPGISTLEALGSAVVSGMAILTPIAVPMVILALVAAALHLRRRGARRSQRGP